MHGQRDHAATAAAARRPRHQPHRRDGANPESNPRRTPNPLPDSDLRHGRTSGGAPAQ